MTALLTILGAVFVLAVAAIAVWLWFFLDIVDQVPALIRIKVEEQVALWRIEAIGRTARAQQRRVRDETHPRSAKDP